MSEVVELCPNCGSLLGEHEHFCRKCVAKGLHQASPPSVTRSSAPTFEHTGHYTAVAVTAVVATVAMVLMLVLSIGIML